MKTTKVIIAISSVGLIGAQLANAQTPDLSTTQNGIGQKIIQSLTDAQKTALEKARELFKSGKADEAKTLLSQNNIKFGIGMHGKGKFGKNGMGDRKAIEDAIIAGNFVNFQTLASSSPLKSIDQATFNLLTPQFKAKKAAEDQIRNILKSAGVVTPEPGQHPGVNK